MVTSILLARPSYYSDTSLWARKRFKRKHTRVRKKRGTANLEQFSSHATGSQVVYPITHFVVEVLSKLPGRPVGIRDRRGSQVIGL